MIKRNPRYLISRKLKIANEELDSLVAEGFAVENTGSFNSPICLVAVPVKKVRLTGDYSTGVNDDTVTLPTTLPRCSDFFTYLQGAKYVACLDLPRAPWQLKLHPDDWHKTAVCAHRKSVMFKRASFGLKTSLPTFKNSWKTLSWKKTSLYT
ncbi:hypothetical protein P9112_011845 [Eukaryota sp. TZLM1-RC]